MPGPAFFLLCGFRSSFIWPKSLHKKDLLFIIIHSILCTDQPMFLRCYFHCLLLPYQENKLTFVVSETQGREKLCPLCIVNVLFCLGLLERNQCTAASRHLFSLTLRRRERLVGSSVNADFATLQAKVLWTIKQ